MISGANEEELELATARMDIMLATNYTPDNPGPLAIIDKYHDKEIERLSKEVTKYDEILCERNNEVDRLYNIINEIEEMLSNPYNVDCVNQNTEFLNRIKELKKGK